MNKNLLMLFCATSLIFGAGVANANQEMKQAMGINPSLAKKMGLSEEQNLKIRTIFEEEQEEMKPYIQKSEAIRKELEKITAKREEKVNGVLSPEQSQYLQELKNKQKEYFAKLQDAKMKRIEELRKKNEAKIQASTIAEPNTEQSEPIMSQEVNKNAADEELPVSDIPAVEIDEQEVMVVADPEAVSK